jgi:hypothetical protein
VVGDIAGHRPALQQHGRKEQALFRRQPEDPSRVCSRCKRGPDLPRPAVQLQRHPQRGVFCSAALQGGTCRAEARRYRERRRIRRGRLPTSLRRLRAARPGYDPIAIALFGLLSYTLNHECRKTNSKTSRSQRAFAGGHRKAVWTLALLCLSSGMRLHCSLAVNSGEVREGSRGGTVPITLRGAEFSKEIRAYTNHHPVSLNSKDCKRFWPFKGTSGSHLSIGRKCPKGQPKASSGG